METLREFEGFFDLVISELDIPGMSGFEFQKRVKNEFQLPLISECVTAFYFINMLFMNFFSFSLYTIFFMSRKFINRPKHKK